MNWKERLNHYLYGSKKDVLLTLRFVSIINALAALSVIIFNIGFKHDAPEIEFIHWLMDLIFGVFAATYLVKVFYSFKRRLYMRETWMEAGLTGIVLIVGFSRYILHIDLLEEIYSNPAYSYYLDVYDTVITLFLLYFIGFEFIKASSILNSIAVKPAATFIFSFLLLIAFGTFLLMLPEMTTVAAKTTDAHRDGHFMTCLFTSVSASCVTGLSMVDISSFYTTKGHIIITVLMQFGGIGIVTFATFFASFLKQGVGIRHQVVIQDFMASESLFSATGLLRQVIYMTIVIEIIATILVYFSWGTAYEFDSFGQKLGYSIFHAISAFCNAGFTLFEKGLMDGQIEFSYLLHIVIAVTIIIGGIGFSTIQDLFTFKSLRDRMKHPWKEWKLSTQIAVFSAGALIVVGAIVFYLLEKDRTLQVNHLSGLESAVESFFQSVTTRTAGFNTVDIGKLATPTLVFMVFLMFIGASSGSTGGGIKTSTFVIIVQSAVATIRGRKKVEMGKRSISQELIYKAFSIFFFAIAYNTVMIFILSISEAHILGRTNPSTGEAYNMVNLVFEQISAFSTVGLSTGVTSDLSILGKSLIMLSMFVGRVGTLTLALALASRSASNRYEYPNAHLMVG